MDVKNSLVEPLTGQIRRKLDMLIVGLTGGISSGKSTVLRIFRKFSSKTIAADEIAHQLTRPGTRVLKEIVKKFGEEVLNRDKTLNRRKLADIIFQDRQKRKNLNAIVHPEIISEIKRKIRQFKKRAERGKLRESGRKTNIIVVDIPLLFEARLEYLVDKIVIVYVPQKIQIERLRRDDNLTVKEARVKVNAQIPIYKKKKYADYIINGNLDPLRLQKQVKSVWKDLLGSVEACPRK
jgi:dephospho-CoA kinase